MYVEKQLYEDKNHGLHVLHDNEACEVCSSRLQQNGVSMSRPSLSQRIEEIAIGQVDDITLPLAANEPLSHPMTQTPVQFHRLANQLSSPPPSVKPESPVKQPQPQEAQISSPLPRALSPLADESHEQEQMSPPVKEQPEPRKHLTIKIPALADRLPGIFESVTLSSSEVGGQGRSEESLPPSESSSQVAVPVEETRYDLVDFFECSPIDPDFFSSPKPPKALRQGRQRANAISGGSCDGQPSTSQNSTTSRHLFIPKQTRQVPSPAASTEVSNTAAKRE
jgi:hypothetical protein